MSDSEDGREEASASLGDSSSTANDAAAQRRQMRLTTSQNIGYCHVCDKQVEIDQDNFSCSECHGGFIELFELDNAAARSSSSSASASANPLAGGTNFLPLLLSQMLSAQMPMNAAGGVNQSASSPTRTSMSIQRRQPAFMMPTRQSSDPGAAGGATGGAVNNTGAGRQARVQLIVPGEQFDLYGIINTVLQDILDTTGRQQNAQIHFHQAPPIRMFQLHGDMRDYAWGASGLDTIITQLLNQLENTGPPPASDTQLHNLPEITISQEDVDKNMQCSICMDEFALNDKAKRLPCRHLFHEPCIVEWLKLHGTCPVCRKNLVGEDTSQHEYIRPHDAATPGAEGAGGGAGVQPTTSGSQQQQQTPPSANSNPTQQQATASDDSNSQRRNPNESSNSTQPAFDMDFD